MSVITTAIAHDVSAQISLWLSDIVDDETRLKYLHGFVEMGVRAPPPPPHRQPYIWRQNIFHLGHLELVAKDVVKLAELEGCLARVGAPPFANLPQLPSAELQKKLLNRAFDPDSQQHCLDCIENHHTNYRFCNDCIVLDYCQYCKAFCHRRRKHQFHMQYSCGDGACTRRPSEEPLTKFERVRYEKVPTVGENFIMRKRTRLWVRSVDGRLIRADLTQVEEEEPLTMG